MKIAITGEKGFLGYHLKNYFNKKCEVINLGKDFIKNINLVIGCDFIIHAAGVNRNPNPSKVYEENVELTKKLVKSLNDNNIEVNIKFISSIQENLNNPYGKSKLECKKILNNYCNKHDLKLETYTLPNLYGTHGKPNYNSFINTFCYNIINNKPIVCDEKMVELCWVYDAIKVIDNQEKSFNVKSVNVCEVAKTLENFKKNINYEKNEFNQNLKDVYNYFKKYKMKIMVLGHTGMLGHTVHEYFKRNNFDVITTNFRFPKKEFKDDILKFDGDFIINCIGSIPQKTSDFKVNSDLPIWLSNNSETKIIHAGTDCEIDNDDYGISKKIASEYISLFSDNTKILKTSIIGLENGTKYGLLEWFLSQEKQVFGYTGAIWNGNTTLEWVKQAYTLMVNWYNYEKITVIEGCEINKYNMLKLFNKVFEKNIKITPKNLGIDKTLKGKIKTQNLEVQLIELKKFWGL